MNLFITYRTIDSVVIIRTVALCALRRDGVDNAYCGGRVENTWRGWSAQRRDEGVGSRKLCWAGAADRWVFALLPFFENSLKCVCFYLIIALNLITIAHK